MSDRGVGGRAGPGIGGDHPIEPAAEKNPEVAPAVAGVMSALKASAAKFREYEAHHLAEAQREFDRLRERSSDPIVATAGRHTERKDKASVNRQMAEMCEKAIADLEASLEGRPERRGAPPPSPSAIFRFGYDHGAMKALWDVMTEEKQESLLAEGKKQPPSDWAAAWADVRTVLARAK